MHNAITLVYIGSNPAELIRRECISISVSEYSNLDAVDALGEIRMPIQVLYGSRDTTVNWESIIKTAQDTDCEVVKLPANYSFI